jgi:hypothetical protein
MAQLFIDFEWKVDSNGYRLLDALPAGPPKTNVDPFGRPLESFLDGDLGKPQRIVRRGGRLVTYRPLEQIDSLFKRFAKVADAQGLLRFVEKFGPLTKRGYDDFESVEPMLEQAANMSAFLEHAAVDKSGLSDWIALQHNGVPLSRMEMRLTLDSMTRQPTLRITPPSLLDALWVQLGQKLSGGGVLRMCQHCGQPFQAGASAGRRADAKFCSTEHKIAFHSLKRSKEK